MVDQSQLSPEPATANIFGRKNPPNIEKIIGTPDLRKQNSNEPDDYFSQEYSRYLRQLQSQTQNQPNPELRLD